MASGYSMFKSREAKRSDFGGRSFLVCFATQPSRFLGGGPNGRYQRSRDLQYDPLSLKKPTRDTMDVRDAMAERPFILAGRARALMNAVKTTKGRDFDKRRGRLSEKSLKYHAGVGLGGQRMRMNEEDEEG